MWSRVFTLAMARIVGESGLVIAVDLQKEMLRILRKRAEKENLFSRIKTIQASPDSLNLPSGIQTVFALAFFVIHEVPDQERLFREIGEAIAPGGSLLIAEPTMHVSKVEFQETAIAAEGAGFRPVAEPKIPLSRSVLMQK
jgi:ubiquinone/menaquinone biosynthesis C-methylase UbiE